MNEITITPEALQHLKDNLATCPANTLGIRIGIRDAGCSGFAYTMDFTAEQLENDKVFDFDGVKIIITHDVLKFLKGTEIKLVQDEGDVNSVLEFDNPNVIHECGCGESFKFKEATD